MAEEALVMDDEKLDIFGELYCAMKGPVCDVLMLDQKTPLPFEGFLRRIHLETARRLESRRDWLRRA